MFLQKGRIEDEVKCSKVLMRYNKMETETSDPQMNCSVAMQQKITYNKSEASFISLCFLIRDFLASIKA